MNEQNNKTSEVVEPRLFVDRDEFVKRIAEIAKMDGVGRMPVAIKFDGKDLVLSYGCNIRMPAAGNWPDTAEFSKAALQRFIKEYCHTHLYATPHTSMKRFEAAFEGSKFQLELLRNGDGSLLIGGAALQCKWK